MTQDVRAVLIKLAYRIHRLRNLPKESYELRHFISRETLDIYAPIANRLGVHQFKWELEDMAFRYLEPQAYRQIAKSLANNRVQRENCINAFIELLQKTPRRRKHSQHLLWSSQTYLQHLEKNAA